LGIVDETLKVLDRIPIWKRLGEVPSEVDDLKKRVAALEEMLGGTWPPDVCKFCGKRAVRLQASFGAEAKTGKARQQWQCGKCGQIEIRLV